MGLNFKTYNQWDDKWKNKTMSPGSLTLGTDGCLVSALAAGISNFAINLNPGELCDKLISSGAFMNTSSLTWSGFDTCFPKLKVMERDDTTSNTFHDANPVVTETAIARLKRVVRRGQVAVLNVDSIRDDGVADHWVLLVDDQFNI